MSDYDIYLNRYKNLSRFCDKHALTIAVKDNSEHNFEVFLINKTTLISYKMFEAESLSEIAKILNIINNWISILGTLR